MTIDVKLSSHKNHLVNDILEKGSSFDIEATAYDEGITTQKECLPEKEEDVLQIS